MCQPRHPCRYTLGAWHFVLVGVFQHASLAHDVLDHRLNTRSCYINPVSGFIYWNMQYHIEHHIFPMVPYYNLPELHEVLKPQLPKPYNGIWEARDLWALLSTSVSPLLTWYACVRCQRVCVSMERVLSPPFPSS